jgi:hypothetical protein
MPSEVRLWEILDRENLKEIEKTRLDLEGRIEDWLEEDISIISDALLVIGRQVRTDSGGFIDLLCIDSQGDITIIELKRDKTPRETTAQILDYGSWVQDLSGDDIIYIADEYLDDKGPLEEAFSEAFGEDLPDVLNEQHKMLIVASGLDPSSERIIRYLSDAYGVGINAVTFNYFRDEDEREYLARAFVVEPERVEYKVQIKGPSKRTASAKRQWDESSFFEDLEHRRGRDEAQVARRILDWAEEKGLRLWWGKGMQDGSFFPMLDHGGEPHWTISVWTYGRLEVQFQQLKTKPPFEEEDKRLELLRRLNEMPGVSIPLDGITRRPSIQLSVLVNETTLDNFLEVLDWVVEQVKAA